jgi:hypothetical protein
MAQNYDINLARALEVGFYQSDRTRRNIAVITDGTASSTNIFVVPSGYQYKFFSYILSISGAGTSNGYTVSAPTSITPPSQFVAFKEIRMFSTTFGLAIDDDNVVYSYNGATWTEQTAPASSVTLNRIAIYSATDACICGNAGVLWYWNGTALSDVTSSTYALYDFDDIDVYTNTRYIIGSNLTAGGASIILHYNAVTNAYTQYAHGQPTETILAVAAPGFVTGDYGWALCSNGDIQQGDLEGDDWTDATGSPQCANRNILASSAIDAQSTQLYPGSTERKTIAYCGGASTGTGAKTWREGGTNFGAWNTSVDLSIYTDVATQCEKQIEIANQMAVSIVDSAAVADSDGLLMYWQTYTADITPSTWKDNSYTINSIDLIEEDSVYYLYVSVTDNVNQHRIYVLEISQLWVFTTGTSGLVQKMTPVPSITLPAGTSIWISTSAAITVGMNVDGFLEGV